MTIVCIQQLWGSLHIQCNELFHSFPQLLTYVPILPTNNKTPTCSQECGQFSPDKFRQFPMLSEDSGSPGKIEKDILTITTCLDCPNEAALRDHQASNETTKPAIQHLRYAPSFKTLATNHPFQYLVLMFLNLFNIKKSIKKYLHHLLKYI